MLLYYNIIKILSIVRLERYNNENNFLFQLIYFHRIITRFKYNFIYKCKNKLKKTLYKYG
jgi:hypothetical protein